MAAIAVLVITFSCQSCSQTSGRVAEKPNIIFIMADDLGYGELGCYGQEYIRTPAIDRIAAGGMKFTRFYSGSPVCAPARCVLMTGRHTGHSFIRNNGNPPGDHPMTPFPGQNPIPDSVLTVAEILKKDGYVTGCIGKWGLGHTTNIGNPGRQGFDFFYGYKCQVHAHNHFPEFLWRNDRMEQLEGNDRTLYGARHSQDLFGKEAVRFIQRHADTSFFLYLPFIIPHLSIQTTDTFLQMYRDAIPEAGYEHRRYLPHPYPRAGYAGMVTQMDHAVGEVLDALEDLGLEEETLVFFTSDNGPTFNRLGGSDSEFFNSSGPFRGRKGQLLEGGIRVPLVVRWPGRIEAGSVNELPFAFWDVLPTLCEVSGNEIPGHSDGISFLPSLTGTGAQAVHDQFYWEFPAYGGQAALIAGDWKLLVRNLFERNDPLSVELYQLSEDIAEQTDLADVYPEKVTEMIREMKKSHVHSELFPFPQLEAFYQSH